MEWLAKIVNSVQCSCEARVGVVWSPAVQASGKLANDPAAVEMLCRASIRKIDQRLGSRREAPVEELGPKYVRAVRLRLLRLERFPSARCSVERPHFVWRDSHQRGVQQSVLFSRASCSADQA